MCFLHIQKLTTTTINVFHKQLFKQKWGSSGRRKVKLMRLDSSYHFTR